MTRLSNSVLPWPPLHRKSDPGRQVDLRFTRSPGPQVPEMRRFGPADRQQPTTLQELIVTGKRSAPKDLAHVGQCPFRVQSRRFRDAHEESDLPRIRTYRCVAANDAKGQQQKCNRSSVSSIISNLAVYTDPAFPSRSADVSSRSLGIRRPSPNFRRLQAIGAPNENSFAAACPPAWRSEAIGDWQITRMTGKGALYLGQVHAPPSSAHAG